MAHLGEKLAEFFYEELPPVEMTEARRHVEACTECRLEVEQFERMHFALRAAPDLDPPRQIVFSLPQRHSRYSWSSWFDWRSAATATAAAAIIVAVVVRFSPAPAPISLSIPTAAPVVVQGEKIDYNRIVSEVGQSERAWLAKELDKRDQEIQRLRGELAYYENFQRAVMKETFENGSAIQLLAQRAELR